MASTRDKRMKTDSPTPAQSNEATTPTTKSSSGTSAIKLKRMSRSRSGMLSSGGKVEIEDGNDSVGLSEDTQSSTASNDNAAKTPNTRTKRQAAKDEKEPEANGDAAAAKEEDESKEDTAEVTDSPSRRITKSQALKNKAALLSSAMARRSAMLKRTSLPLPVKASLRNLTRRSNSKPNESESPVAAAAAAAVVTPKKGKVVKKEPKKEPEDEEESMEPEADAKSEVSTNDTEANLDLKHEKSQSDIQNVRRSTRQRKSTIKDRDSPFTRRSQARDKSESKRDSVSPALSSTSIKTEKDSAKAISITVETSESATGDKDPSLSPELVSEELDTESVQQLYDKPDFLENNLGIEKDPKLGEIVKVQEKVKTTTIETLITTTATAAATVATVETKEEEEEEVDEKPLEEEIKEEEEMKVEEKPAVAEETAVVEEETEAKKGDDKMEVVEEAPKAEEEKIEEEAKSEPVNGAPREDEKMEVDETEQTENAESKKEDEKVAEVNNDEVVSVKVKAVEKEKEKEPKVVEPIVNEIKEEKSDKIEESSEENKENNNVEMSPKSGNNSPRSEDRLKIMSEGNTPKPELTESAELLKQKESHFLSLGLFTHKAAEEAKLAKQKRKEELALQAAQQEKRKAKKDSSDQSGTSKTSGTLKTIIKLNRNDKEKRKARMPLKMTFQKKNRDRDSNGSSNSENSFYTIQNEKIMSSDNAGAISRKSQSRSYNHDQVASSNDQNKTHEPVVNKELEQSLVIPEKASSFKVHPERICKDQCFYCGGKFGLYDTPCHIAQIKSTERQTKILDNEEKLTKDSCLCDACFRHVDRRANCPSYRNKHRSMPSSHEPSTSSGASPAHQSQSGHQNYQDRSFGVCNVIDCNENAVHSIRKKWFVKMRKTIAKIFQVNLDLQPTNTNVSICEEHFAALSHIMVCAMCKRKLPRNHIFYINQDIARLEHLIGEQGLHVKLANSTLVVCKLCSYYNNLLFKPPEPKTQKADFVKNYTKKLMKYNSMENEYANRHIVSVDDDEVQEVPLRNDDLTLTIKNGKIQPKKPQDRFHNSKEVTITTMKGSAQGGNIMLDNDVMVGYDVPNLESCPSPPAHTIRNPNYKGPATATVTTQKAGGSSGSNSSSKGKKDDNSDMARALKSNPNISMRELFPGEDEMALQINLPFNSNSAHRTPEGWAKVQMTIQYDDVTKALWEHLQRPYGNQSSFIRHLLLLEKYYRNGDLVLSQSASNSATTYSESVRNRLRSYDNIPSSLASGGAQNLSNEITITPTNKPRNKSNDSLTITPQPGNSLLKRKSSQSSEMSGSPKQKVQKTAPVVEEAPKKTSPPELISFNQQKPNTRSSAKEKDPPASSNSQAPNADGKTAMTSAQGGNVVVLPDTLTPLERKQCTKSWRPTLIPITGSGQLLNSNGPLYQTADGRKLPELVQVMSGGKPYHISIHDYNKMCIIRREKLQQQLNQKARQHAATQNTAATANNSNNGSPNSASPTTAPATAVVSNAIPASTNSLSIIPMPKDVNASVSNNNNNNNNNNSSSFKPALTSTPSNAITSKLTNIPNQILEQNSFIPLNSSGEQNGKRHQNGSGLGLPPPLTSAFAKSSSSGNNSISSMLPPALSALSKTVNALQPTSSHAAQLAAWNSLWNDNEININSDNMAALAQIANLANLGTVGIIDQSAASLLSKIPKSLTVIPQAKNDRRSSDEQKHTSAST